MVVEGFRVGKYGKIVFEGVLVEFVKNFLVKRFIIVGGFFVIEDRFGFV